MTKNKEVFSTNSFYQDIKRVYYSIIAKGKVSRHKNFAEYVTAVVEYRMYSTK